MELTKVTESISHVDGDDEGPVMALWRMENAARARRVNPVGAR